MTVETDLSIIIVNYNVKEYLQNLVQSIRKASQNLNVEIIIVDNASDDGSVDLIREKLPEIKLIANEKNLGFGKANNIALKEAKGRFILLLNPDTIVSEDTFETMIRFFKEHPEAGLAGCKILNPDGTLQLACRRSFPGPWTSFTKVTGLSTLFPDSKLFARYNLTYLDENKTYEVDAISGAFMMLKREVYETVGGFDEDFFMYGEDLDWCYRIQSAGYKVYYVHSTRIIHYKGESTRRSSIDETKMFYDAMQLFVKKHFSGSFFTELILRVAIGLRMFFAFAGKIKMILLYILLDIIFFDLSLLLAEMIYMANSDWTGFDKDSLPLILTLPALLQVSINALLGNYRRKYLSVLRSMGGVIAGFILLTSLTFFFKQYAYSRAVAIIVYFLVFLFFTGWRTVLKLFFGIGLYEEKIRNRRTIVVGLNESTLKIAKKLKVKKTDNFNVLGLIGFSNKDIGKKIEELNVIGSLQNIRKIIRDKKVSEVIFSADELSYNQMMVIVSECQGENVEFRLLGRDLDFIVGKTSVLLLDDLPLFEIQYNITKPLNRIVKAVFDFLTGSFTLFLVFPFIYFKTKITKRKTDFDKFVLGIPEVVTLRKSLVGPKSVNIKQNLFLGKPGLTGFWYTEQDDTNDELRLDILYAKNQTIWLDIEILGKTFIKMWSKKLSDG
ncbi:MAG: glycosyltransferase [Ignavibacteriaceae bacterium]